MSKASLACRVEYSRLGNLGAFGRNVGTLPLVGVDSKVGTGEEGSVETI